MVAGTDADALQMVGEPVAASLELGERQPSVSTDERLTVTDDVDDLFEDVCEVELHVVPSVRPVSQRAARPG